MNTLNSTERSDNLFILYCLCLPLLWVKDEETSVWLSTLYNVIIQCFIFIHISVLDLKMIIYTSKSVCVNGFLVLKGAQCCYGEDILIRSKTESKENDAHWLILFLNKQNKKTVFVFMTDCLNKHTEPKGQHRCKLFYFVCIFGRPCHLFYLQTVFCGLHVSMRSASFIF